MQNNIHFISGLPRSGSTLLSALLRQNPRFHASMTSPVGSLLLALQREMSQGTEYGQFWDNEQRTMMLRGVFDTYYHQIHPKQLVFDTNRMWTTKLPVLKLLFPRAKTICCVRNVAWVLDSIESLLRRNCLETSKIFNFEPGGTVYTRVEGLATNLGLVGFSLHAVREAVFGEQAGDVILVRYESLTADPLGTLKKIYQFIDEPLFAHDRDHIEPCLETEEFDRRLGTPGLHRVGSSVVQVQRPSILPPDLFKRYEAFSFWQNPGEMPPGIPVI